MQLLSTEMSNQDPLQPMDPTQTMTQLAQFTTLQQTSQISQTQSLAAANSFLGAEVSLPGTNGGSPLTGIVTGIDTSQVASGSLPQLIVNGSSQEYPITSVTMVQQAPSAATTATSTSTPTAATPTSTSTSTTTP